ncbi:MAG: ATP-binding cassette domain-containing protein [bacterium]
MITIRELKKNYGEKTILEIPKQDFEKERIYCIFGPNGAGKTTLLNLLSFLDKPSSGTIEFKGERRNIGYLRQDPLLFQRSIFSNIELGLKIRKIRDKNRVYEIMDELSIEKIKDKKPDEISYGELKRVALARAIVFEPEVLLLDEPTANIDPTSIKIIEGLIKRINKEKRTTIIFSTHNISSGYRVTDDILSIVSGRIENGGIKNLFPCIFPKGKGLKQAMIKDDVGIWVITEDEGKGHILIEETAIVVSKEPLISSCRNSLKGRVIKLEEIKKDMVSLGVDVLGLTFYATITLTSVSLLSITLGSSLYLSFKASEVRVI